MEGLPINYRECEGIKGGKLYTNGDGYFFGKNFNHDGYQHLTCKTKLCNGSAKITRTENGMTLVECNKHSDHCKPDFDFEKIISLRKRILSRCSLETTPYITIFQEECERATAIFRDPTVVARLTYSQMLTTMKRARRKRTAQQMSESLERSYIQASDSFTEQRNLNVNEDGSEMSLDNFLEKKDDHFQSETAFVSVKEEPIELDESLNTSEEVSLNSSNENVPSDLPATLVQTVLSETNPTNIHDRSKVRVITGTEEDFTNMKSVVFKLERISEQLASATDQYEQFGKYLATLLRGIPHKKFMSLKQKLVNDVFQAMMALDDSATTATRSEPKPLDKLNSPTPSSVSEPQLNTSQNVVDSDLNSVVQPSFSTAFVNSLTPTVTCPSTSFNLPSNDNSTSISKKRPANDSFTSKNNGKKQHFKSQKLTTTGGCEKNPQVKPQKDDLEKTPLYGSMEESEESIDDPGDDSFRSWSGPADVCEIKIEEGNELEDIKPDVFDTSHPDPEGQCIAGLSQSQGNECEIALSAVEVGSKHNTSNHTCNKCYANFNCSEDLKNHTALLHPDSAKEDIHGKSGNKCCFAGCGRTRRSHPQLRMFRFPVKNAEVLGDWLINCANNSLLTLSDKALHNRVVCQLHFSEDSFTNDMKTFLKKDAVPTIPNYI